MSAGGNAAGVQEYSAVLAQSPCSSRRQCNTHSKCASAAPVRCQDSAGHGASFLGRVSGRPSFRSCAPLPGDERPPRARSRELTSRSLPGISEVFVPIAFIHTTLETRAHAETMCGYNHTRHPERQFMGNAVMTSSTPSEPQTCINPCLFSSEEESRKYQICGQGQAPMIGVQRRLDGHSKP